MITTHNSIILSRHDVAEVRYNANSKHHSLFAVEPFEKGQVITPFYAGSVQPFATYLTVQTGIDRHITLKPDFLQFVNHSCDPNVFFDTKAMEFIALNKTNAGEELCFFYPSTEWDMAQPFNCFCGTSSCLNIINGAAHIYPAILSKYRLTDFILNQLDQKHNCMFYSNPS